MNAPRGYSVRILLDSRGPSGCRLTTWVLRYPRFVHADLMSHRQFSRNASSSRAAPVMKTWLQVWREPALPLWWGANQAGMQAHTELTGWRLWASKRVWDAGRALALACVWVLMKVGLHKQLANRMLEPWAFITVVMSSTEHANWFALRDGPDAQPELAWVAHEMRQQYDASVPQQLLAGEWHVPFLREEDAALPLTDRLKVAVGRCARVSYLTHDGRRAPNEDIVLHDRLKAQVPAHMSPFEHLAQALETAEPSGNFVGWRQYRKTFANEHVGRVRS